MRSDPNGYDWEALGYSSLEAFIEHKAGAAPPDWPQESPPPFEADDEDDPAPRGDADA